MTEKKDFEKLLDQVENELDLVLRDQTTRSTGITASTPNNAEVYVPIHKMVIKEEVNLQARLEKALGPDAEKLYLAARERDRKLTEELARRNAEIQAENAKNQLPKEPEPAPLNGWYLVMYQDNKPSYSLKIEPGAAKPSLWARVKAFVSKLWS